MAGLANNFSRSFIESCCSDPRRSDAGIASGATGAGGATADATGTSGICGSGIATGATSADVATADATGTSGICGSNSNNSPPIDT